MSRRRVTTDDRTYMFSPDDQVLLGDRMWALVWAQVTDELTGQPPRSPLIITADGRGMTPRLGPGGLVGLTGIPRNVFPNLAAQNYDVTLRVGAAGYISQECVVQIPQLATFPTVFQAPPLTHVALHRELTVLVGRTVQASGNTTTPVAGATVRVAGIWRTAPPANMAVPAAPPNLVFIQPPLYAARSVLTGQLRGFDLLPIVGDDKLLLDDVPPDTHTIRLSNRQNLMPGDILLVDTDNPDRTEYLAISAIAGASTLDQPAYITLDYALANPHRNNVRVQRVTPQAPGAVKQCTDTALPGDSCVFLNDLSGLAGFAQVRLSGGPNPDEYHSIRLFSTTSDLDGYYRLPPLSRVAQIHILAEKAPLTLVLPAAVSLDQPQLSPDYTRRENRLDFTFV